MAGERQTEPHQAGHRYADGTLCPYCKSEPHQAEGVIYDCPHAEVCKTCPCSHEDDACFPGERLRAEVARLRAERDELIAEREIPSDAIRMLEAQRAEWRVRAEAAQARVAELEAERDSAREWHRVADGVAIKASERADDAEAALEGVQDRIDRAVTERTAALEAALREAISWSYGEDVTPERRDEIEREFLAPTRTREDL